SETKYSWNYEQGQLVGNYRNETFFNEFGEEIKIIFYNWDFDLNNWSVQDVIFTQHSVFLSDSEGNVIAYEITTWDETAHQWLPKEKHYYFWSSHGITGLPEVLTYNRFVEVYPNPATDIIFVRLFTDEISGTISLFNSTGQLLKKLNLTSNLTPIQVNEMPKGICILHLETNQLAETKKVLIQ
ncbi:T9SS type A sorting domain-containing protein, partial [Mariniphaga sp.]|uniref:T9SS type A sorting domain-containing protein n=1 Tax=Mariniphaga sp. TaxID=1954475 RepID=UPI0035687D16